MQKNADAKIARENGSVSWFLASAHSFLIFSGLNTLCRTLCFFARANSWPNVGNMSRVPSLVANTACPSVRVARAMELAYAGVIRVKPASDFPLSPWLSTSVVVVASQTFAAYASVGLSWPSLNSYLLKPQIGPAIAELVSSLTNGRVLTAVAAKKIYRTNIRVFKTLLVSLKTSGSWTVENTGGLPLPFFLMK